MTTTRKVLTDVDQGIWVDDWQIDAASGPVLAGAKDWSIRKRTLRGGLSDGLDVVELKNGELSMSVLPTRGMGLWRGEFRGIPIKWKSPVVRPVHPMFVNLKDRNGLGWLNGFNELMCRCGLAFNGPPGTDGGTDVTLHGKIANLAAHFVAVEVDDSGDGALSLEGCVDETTMFGPAMRLTTKLSTSAGSHALTIRDRVTNLGAQPTDLELLYHTNIGRPFLGAGSRLVAAIAEVAPRDAHSANGAANFESYPGPITGCREEAFFFELLGDADDRTTVLLVNQAGDRGFSLSYSTRELPCFTVWKNPQAEADGYVTGLEPGTNFPNFRSFEREQGRVISLPPGATYEASFELRVYDSAADLVVAERAIRALQTREPVRHAEPIAKWSAIG